MASPSPPHDPRLRHWRYITLDDLAADESLRVQAVQRRDAALQLLEVLFKQQVAGGEDPPRPGTTMPVKRAPTVLAAYIMHERDLFPALVPALLAAMCTHVGHHLTPGAARSCLHQLNRCHATFDSTHAIFAPRRQGIQELIGLLQKTNPVVAAWLQELLKQDADVFSFWQSKRAEAAAAAAAAAASAAASAGAAATAAAATAATAAAATVAAAAAAATAAAAAAAHPAAAAPASQPAPGGKLASI